MISGDGYEGFDSPEEEAAYEALVRKATIGARLEAELQDKNGAIALLVKRAREEAVGALVALVNLEPSDYGEVMKLQNEARRYSDICAWIEEALDDANEASSMLDDADREGIEDMINPNKRADA